MTAAEHTEATKEGKDATTHERRIQSLGIGGSDTVFSGLRFVGGGKPWSSVVINGHHIRVTDSVFDGCTSSTWLATGQPAFECEIDHCRFADKDFKAGGGQTMRLFGGQSKYPGGHSTMAR